MTLQLANKVNWYLLFRGFDPYDLSILSLSLGNHCFKHSIFIFGQDPDHDEPFQLQRLKRNGEDLFKGKQRVSESHSNFPRRVHNYDSKQLIVFDPLCKD